MAMTTTNNSLSNFHVNNATKPTSQFYTLPNTAVDTRRLQRARSRKNRKKTYRNLQIIREISALETNWNGNDAPTFDESLIAITIKIIENITRQPDIFPTARQSIQLEYEKTDGDYLEFEVFEDKIIALVMHGKEEKESTFAVDDFKKIDNMIGDFHEK